MEHLVLKVLGFDLAVPTVLDFLERFLKAAHVADMQTPKVEALSKVTVTL